MERLKTGIPGLDELLGGGLIPGTLTAVVEMPWYLRTLQVSRPLHFGDYGGMPLKIFWALLDLVTIAVLGSGLYLWLSRRKSPIEAQLAEIEELADGA